MNSKYSNAYIIQEIKATAKIKTKGRCTKLINLAVLPESLIKFEDMEIKQVLSGDMITLDVRVEKKPDDRIRSILRTIDDFLAAIKFVLGILEVIDEID